MVRSLIGFSGGIIAVLGFALLGNGCSAGGSGAFYPVQVFAGVGMMILGSILYGINRRHITTKIRPGLRDIFCWSVVVTLFAFLTMLGVLIFS
jgi:hypothetical protein